MPPLKLSGEELRQLQSIANPRSMPHSIVQRAQIVLACGAGESNTAIAKRMGVTGMTVGKWRKRYQEFGTEGLHDELRPGRPRTYEDDKVAGVINRALQTKKPAMAVPSGVRARLPLRLESQRAQSNAGSRHLPSSPIARKRTASRKPCGYKLSTDPFFIEKVRDIVGLYLNPPDKAMVLCVDEKTQVQALDRTQPMLPMGLGYVEGVTHDCIRHGTTTLFAALNIATEEVITQCRPRHRHQEFLGFLREIEKSVPPPELDLHLIVDNYVTHKHPKVTTWLVQRPRFMSISPQPMPHRCRRSRPEAIAG
jgi:putative transposase